MGIKLGNNSVNKAYLGATEIQKMYLGTNLVFDNTAPVTTLKPIMTNFAVRSVAPYIITFETPLGSVEGINHEDFTIDGLTITDVTIQNETAGHFTIVENIDYWDNYLIRKEGGDNSVVYDFTVQQIQNLEDEPDANIFRYVTTSGGTGAGTEGDPWSLAHAMSNATSGMTVYIAPGTYPNNSLTLAHNGTITAPIKFIGTGANLSPTKSVGMSFNASNMPLIEGSGNSGNWLSCGSNEFIIFKNLQIQGFGGKGFSANNSMYMVWDNVYMKDGTHSIEINNTYSSHHLKALNCYSADVSALGIRFDGYQNFVKDTMVCSSKVVNMDYYIAMNFGQTRFDNNSVIGCYVERFPTDTHGGHGIEFKCDESGGGQFEYGLCEDCDIVNTAFEFRHSGVKYNVARNVRLTSSNGSGTMIFRDGCSYNRVEDCLMDGIYSGISFRDNPGEDGTKAGGHYNKVINSIFNDIQYFIYEAPIDGSSILESTNNEWINCTFKGSGSRFFTSSYSGLGSTNKFTNCIWDSTPPTITGTFNPTIENSDLYNVGSWGNAYIGSNGNINVNPQLANYQPQAAFSSIQAPRIDGIFYDKDGEERANPTTLGSVLSSSEVVTPPAPGGELVIDGSFSQGSTYWDIGGGTSAIANNEATIATTGAFAYLSQDNVMQTGLQYTVEFDVIATNGETLASNLDEIVWDTSTVGHKVQIITAPEARLMFKRRVGTTDTNITLDNISVKLN